MSGVPGSGKTHLAKKMFPKSIVCSADSYFTKDGEYRFYPSKLGEAHGECLRCFVSELTHGSETIVVDNTNTIALELAPYVALASAYGAKVTLCNVVCDPEVAHQRNTHGVPLEAILQMHGRINARVLPPYWNMEVVTIKN